MKLHENETFDRFEDRDSGAVFSEVEFRHCNFVNCSISKTHSPSLRSTIRNVHILNCTANGSSLGTAVIEYSRIESLYTNKLFQTFGTAFNQVVLRGRFDRLMIADDYLPPVLLPEDRRRSEISLFRDANLEFYQNVQWALDISEAEFKELSIRGIPASLIRRDPETQVVVTRERALNCDWSNLSLNENLWPTTIDLFLRGEDSDVILIAPKRHPKFRRYLEDIHILQKEGIAV